MEPTEIVRKSLIRRNEESVYDYGKVPPQAKELEEAVLGAILMDSFVSKQVAPFLMVEMFYVDQHQRICRAILMLSKRGEPVESLTVVEQLKKNGELEAAGGPFYIAQLANKVGSTANIDTHLKYVFEKYVQRCLISSSSEIIREAYEDTCDVFEIFEKAEKQLQELRQLFHTGSISTTESVLEEAERQSSSGFVPSKHKFINMAFGGGWQKGTLNIVAARPGMGKSAFHVSELVHCVSEKINCASFNLEMMQRQLVTRIICNLTAIQNTKYVRDTLNAVEQNRVEQAKHWIRAHDYNLSMDFTAGIVIHDLISKLRKIKAEKGLDIAFIDHLQFIRLPASETKGKSRDMQIGEITSALKTFAKENDVALVVFCHLSRETEKGASKRPGLSHLRESGNIENDADTVSFLFRAEYYFDKDENGVPQYKTPEQRQYQNICQFLNDKNRDGHTFDSEMKCFLGTSNFIDLPKDEAGAQQEKMAVSTGRLPYTDNSSDDTPF